MLCLTPFQPGRQAANRLQPTSVVVSVEEQCFGDDHPITRHSGRRLHPPDGFTSVTTKSQSVLIKPHIHIIAVSFAPGPPTTRHAEAILLS